MTAVASVTLCRRGAAALAALFLLGACAAVPPSATPPMTSTSPQPESAEVSETPPVIQWGLVIHGGAGTITRGSMTEEMERQYRTTMEASLRAGHAALAGGGSGLDAVVAATNILEDSPLFNAGRGAVFTAEGRNELDASIMDGATLRAGAVAGVTRVKNPINLARRVMEASPHVMLSGAGAEEFAELQRLELVDPSWFHTDRRWESLQRAREAAQRRESSTDPGGAGNDGPGGAGNDGRFGTVGVVALARDGTIAAGTSTGGMTNKRWGRIGDAPIIGAGTYADDRCGVSTTGWGEYFIRNVVAYDICARMRYKGISLQQAAHEVIWERLEAQEPETGGIVSLDAEGHVVMTFNSRGMYRGYIDQDGRVVTAIYR
jgi:L-asparaginase / beta-aspartyl-peptidase